MKIVSHGATDRGRIREFNEDAVVIDDLNRLYGVADGLGGLPGGAEASRRTLELIQQAFAEPGAPNTPAEWSALITEINQTVSDEGQKAHPFTGSGSTLTLAHVKDRQLTLVHVGDSAAYLQRSDKLSKLTIDHTLEQAWIDEHGETA